MIGRWITLTFSTLLVGVPDPGAATETQAAPYCELHAWPGPPMQMLSEGLLLNHKLDEQLGAVKRVYPDGSSPLDTARQIKLLRDADLARLFNRPGALVIVHEETTQRRQSGAARTRRTPSTAECYSEIVVDRLFYTKNAMSRGSLRVLFAMEDYGVAPAPSFTFAGLGDAAMRLFPPTTTDAVAAADTELSVAFTTALDQFATRAGVRRAVAQNQ